MTKITSATELAKVKKAFEGEVVELPAFDDGTPFNVKLKRASLLGLAKKGAIPNQLLGAVQEIYEGRQRADIKKYAEVLDIVCAECMVEPAFDDVKDLITDTQQVAILAYAQHGVAGLKPFRAFSKFSTNDNSSKK
jgi:hypothetical protein